MKLSDEMKALKSELEDLQARIDAALNRQQEPDRFLTMAREAVAQQHAHEGYRAAAAGYRAGERDHWLGPVPTYLREQCEASEKAAWDRGWAEAMAERDRTDDAVRAELLERVLARFEPDHALSAAATLFVHQTLKAEFAKEPVR